MVKKIIGILIALICIVAVIGVSVALFPSSFYKSLKDECGQYKNVILMIADGTGDNCLENTRKTLDTALAMDSMPVYGHSNTNSFIKDYTDSAAGATALACGVRTFNGMVSRFPYVPFAPFDKLVPISLTELAKASGRSAGVVTTDQTSGATPAAFSSHAINRKMEKDISSDQLGSDID